MLRAYGVTDRGRIRPTNEDCFAVDEALCLCVVADGIGGQNAGEVASRIAVDAIVDFIADARSEHGRRRETLHPFGTRTSLSDAGNFLRTAIHLANLQILEAAGTCAACAGMGTTIVAALAVGDRLAVGHVGDSRLYLSVDGRLAQLTHDDSWMADVLARDPGVDAAALRHHPMRNALTNVVGAHPRTDVHIVERTLTGGEVLLLSTDGVHGVLGERRLEQLLAEGLDPAPAAAKVVRAALGSGSRDNCTAVVARYLPA